MRTLYLVPHTHYDVVWSFTKEDYLQINERILKKATDLVKDRGFKFLVEQTYLLEQFEQRYPRLFADIRDAIKEGTIELADGQYLMPDTMIPHGEVLVREILFGKSWAKEKFGVDVPVAWCADGFGLNAQLPQLYKRSGYRWVAFRRGMPKALGSKVSEFLWEGLDGTRIPAHWMPMGYRAGLFLDEWEESVAKLASLATTDHILMPCGSGSTPPQPETPERIEAWNASHEDSRIVMATPREFFEAFDEALDGNLTVHHGELYRPDIENVFQDVVTTRIGLKQAMRRVENLLLLTEKASTMAWLEGLPYPHIELRDAWKGMLFLAFHDVVSGSSIDEVYDEAWDIIHGMEDRLPPLLRKAMIHLVHDDTVGESIVVFNPTGTARTDWVECDLQLGDEWGERPGVAFEGSPVPSELLEVELWDDGSPRRARIGFEAEVPALGARVYHLTDTLGDPDGAATVEDDEVTTPFYKVRVDPKTGVLEVRDLEGELLVRGNEVVLDEERGDLYFQVNPLDRPICREEAGDHDFGFAAFKPDSLSIRTGPVRTVIDYTTSYYCVRWPYRMLDKMDAIIHRQRTLHVQKRVVLYHDNPRIDLRTRIDTRHPHTRIKVLFDTGLDEPAWTRETQFGAVEVADAVPGIEDSVKLPSQSWLAAEDGERGVGFITRGAPYSEVHNGVTFLTLLRSVSVLCADGKSGPFIPTPEAMELGEHEYHYALLPYQGDWASANLPSEALGFTQSLVAYTVDTEPLDKLVPGFEVSPENLVLSTLTKAHNEDAAILRFYESQGRASRARIALPRAFASAHVVDLLEREERELEVRGGTVELDVGPFEIVTLKFGP